MSGQDVFTDEGVVALGRALSTGAGTLLELAFAIRDGDDPEACSYRGRRLTSTPPTPPTTPRRLTRSGHRGGGYQSISSHFWQRR